MRFDPKAGYEGKGISPFPVPEGAVSADLRAYVPQLSLAERNRRWRELRKRMLFANLDVLVFIGNDIFWDMGMANMRYILQVGSKMGAWAIFPIEGDPVVWHAIPHMSRPTELYLSLQDWVTDFRPFSGPAPVVNELENRGFSHARIGLVGFSSTIVRNSTLLHGDVLGLQKALPEAEIIDVSWML